MVHFADGFIDILERKIASFGFTSWRLKRLYYDRHTRKTIMRILDTGRFRRIVCTAFDRHGDVGTESGQKIKME